MRATNQEKINWLLDHEDLWSKDHDAEEMLNAIAKGFFEASLVAAPRYVSDSSTFKLIQRAAVIARERRTAK